MTINIIPFRFLSSIIDKTLLVSTMSNGMATEPELLTLHDHMGSHLIFWWNSCCSV